jgi:hypothetical protein
VTSLAHRAGGALLWRGLAMGGENIIFLVRLVVLARLLMPEDFGLVAIGLVALAIAMSLTEFGIVAALIQQPAADKRHLDTAWTHQRDPRRCDHHFSVHRCAMDRPGVW